jgi:PHS family inorganic phosphate transporter-like MFS transporter
VNAASNIGNIIGQLVFGFLGDTFGRKFVYGKELIVCIIGTILVISLPNSIPTPTLKMIWIFCFRVLMGVGIGGDYPMSASIVSERSHLKKRGQLLAWIFSNQGCVSLGISVFGHELCIQKVDEDIRGESQLTQYSFSRAHSQVPL